MLAGSTLVSALRLTAWLTLVLVAGADVFRVALHPGILVAVLAVAAPLAASGLISTLASIWRGPPLISLSPEEGMLCAGEDSDPVRAYAQLRGSIGGAGHVRPGRLAYPVVSWAAALVAGLKPVAGPTLEFVGPWPLGLAMLATIGAWFFPARPYWYREVSGGGALVVPPEAVGALVERGMSGGRPGVAAVHATGRAIPLLQRRHSELTHFPSADKSARRRAPRYPLSRELIVQQGGMEFRVATINVSDGGLAVRWPAENPILGESIVFRLDDDRKGRGLEATVCWKRDDADRNRAVGLELYASEVANRAWLEVVAAAAGSSAT